MKTRPIHFGTPRMEKNVKDEKKTKAEGPSHGTNLTNDGKRLFQKAHTKYATIVFLCLTLFGCGGKKIPLLKPPELVHCSCDSATYCLTDEDVINIHAWYASMKHLTGD